MAITPTTFQIGAWQSSSDSFVSHPASPTGAIINLNDGIVWSLQDSGKGSGDGLDLGNLAPTLYKSSNPRTVGERVVAHRYDQNRTIKAKLFWGTGATYATWIAAVRNLAGLCEGITQQNPAALQIQVTGASAPIYADVLEAHVNVPYDELLWAQYLQESVEVSFFCKPFFRGARLYLQNDVTNPGFECPSGPAVTVFNDNFTNYNAYTSSAQAFRNAVLLNGAIRYYRLSDAVGAATAIDAAGSGNAGTVNGTVTFGGSPGAISGDSATYATFNGTTGYVSSSTLTGFPTGNGSWTIGCWCYVTGSPGGTATLLTFGLNSTAHGAPQITMSNTRTVSLSDATTATAASAALSINAWHFLVGTYDTATLRIYIDGAAGNTAAATVAVPGAGTYCVLGATALASPTQFFPGRLQDCFFVPWIALSATEIANLYNTGLATFTPSALTTDVFRYSDAVLADNPLRYYRLDETYGTTAYDAMATGYNGTYTGGVTLGVTGALTSDADTSITLNGSTGYISCPVTGLPTGNASWSLECWVKVSAYPGTNYALQTFGTLVANSRAMLYMTSTGTIATSCNGTTTTGGVAVSTGAWHHCVGTWDGTTLKTYVDGAAYGVNATPGTLTIGTTYYEIGRDNSNGIYLNGSIDEPALYGAALSAGRITAHYNAGHNAPSANSGTMLIAQDGSVAFGNAAWSDVNQWQTTFRYVNGLGAGWYLHYRDANNYFAVQISGSQMTLQQCQAGKTIILATNYFTLVNGVTYILQISQVIPSFPPQFILSLFVNTVTQPTILSGVTAPVQLPYPTALGACRISTTGGNLALEAPGNTVKLFGPGGWTVASTGTGVASSAWESTLSNCYPSGLTTSYRAALTTVAPAGSLNVGWTNADTTSGTTITRTAFPASTGQVIYASVYLHSTGIANSCTQYLQLVEYDTNGSVLRATALQSVTNNQAWTKLSGNVTLGVNTQYVALSLLAIDATAASANGNIWWDNCQLWNSTTAGATTMPYCEMRFPQAPAVVLLTGIQGDVATPATLSAGLWVPAWSGSGSVTYAIGRRSIPTANGAFGLVNTLSSRFTTPFPVIDASNYGGYYLYYAGVASCEFDAYPPSPTFSLADLAGNYHTMGRMQSSEATVTSVNVKTNLTSAGNAFNAGATTTTVAYGTAVYPLSTANVWKLADGGVIAVPAFTAGALSNLANYSGQISQQWADPVGTSNFYGNWYAHLPVDVSTVLGTINNGSSPTSNQWLWLYIDGSTVINAATAVSLETSALPAYQDAVGGTGTTSTGYLNVNPTGDPYLTLDPGQAVAGTTGINQLVVVMQDQAMTVSPIMIEVSYVPLYLYPR